MSFFYFYLLILVHPYLSLWWLSFPKAGRKSWEALIPGYNYFVMFKITCDKPFWSLLMLFPGVHLIMLATANVSYLRRFGYYSFTDTLQGILFPYLLMYKVTQEQAVFGAETNWSNSREIEIRKWGDHIVLFLCLPVIGHAIALAIGAVTREQPGVKSRVKEWGDSILFALVAASIIRTYVFEPFQIPTGSMEKTLLVGDFLFVNKLAYGPKVPVTPLSYPLVHNTIPWVNIKSYTTLESGSYTRLPGFGTIKNDDVVVFNYPSGDTAVYDPRMPDGLMGHDYHGILNNEAQYLFVKQFEEVANTMARQISDSIKKSNPGINYYEDKLFLHSKDIAFAQILKKNGKIFIESIEKWKQLAREKLARGEFPGEPNGMKHGGLIYRPVDKRENYIKRCVGIPGDRLKIVNSILYVNGKKAKVSPEQCLKYKIEKAKVTFPNQEEMFSRYNLENDPTGARIDFDANDETFYFLNLTIKEKTKIENDFKIKLEVDVIPLYSKSKNYKPTTGELISNISTFPKDFYVNNNVTNFEEFQVPFKGKVVDFKKENIAYYRRIITAYEGHKLEEKKDGIYIDGKKTTTYKIQMNYYWLMGDNRYNSADSRIWGFVPEDHVVGRASLVWFSKSAYMGIRWERLFKLIK